MKTTGKVTVDARKYMLLIDLVHAVYDCFNCLDECDDGQPWTPLGYAGGRPCPDCDCWKCMAARALRARSRRKP